MQADADPSIYRYFELADSFVEVRCLGARKLGIRARSGMNRDSYIEAVLASCLPSLEDDPDATLELLCPDEVDEARAQLYRLCIEVNPGLDIRSVQLAAEESEAGDVAPATCSEREDQADGVAARAWAARLADLRGELAREVLGQDAVIERIAAVLRRAAAGLSDPRRPLASLLFCGRTGTGKTELARGLARVLFAHEDLHGAGEASRTDPESSRQKHSGLIRIDCTEFASAHESARLIGAPPGYVGHEEGGFLTERVARAGACVVLFDEVEKAHPQMRNLLLQILEEGCLTDGRGRRVSFRDTIVVMTTNSGAEGLRAAAQPVGFEREVRLARASIESITHSALRQVLAPELMGRLDQILLFRDLDSADARRIARKQLLELGQRAQRLGLALSVSPSVAGWVARRGFDLESGARGLRQVIESQIEPGLSDALLRTGEERPHRLHLCIQRDRPTLRRPA